MLHLLAIMSCVIHPLQVQGGAKTELLAAESQKAANVLWL